MLQSPDVSQIATRCQAARSSSVITVGSEDMVGVGTTAGVVGGVTGFGATVVGGAGGVGGIFFSRDNCSVSWSAVVLTTVVVVCFLGVESAPAACGYGQLIKSTEIIISMNRMRTAIFSRTLTPFAKWGHSPWCRLIKWTSWKELFQ